MARNNTRLSMRGKLLVHNILQGSQAVDLNGESELPYDIAWEGITIDVKTTSMAYGKNSRYCMFSRSVSPRHDGVRIFVYLTDNAEYFWVEKTSRQASTYLNIRSAITREQLPGKVREESQRPVEARKN